MTRKLLIVFAFLIPFIAVSSASADSRANNSGQVSSSVPGIQQTSQWRSLQSYVAFLEQNQTVAATSAQKETYLSTLNQRQAAANNKVQALYNQSIQIIINRDQKKEQRQINKLQKARSKQVGELKKQRSERIAAARDNYQAQVATKTAAYAASVASAKEQLQTLRKNLAKTTNPFKRQVILNQIQTVQLKINNLGRSFKNSLADLRSSYIKKVSKIRTVFAGNLTNTQNYYRGLINEVRNTWKTLYKEEVSSAKVNRQRQFQLVTTLRNQGATYINNMPPTS